MVRWAFLDVPDELWNCSLEAAKTHGIDAAYLLAIAWFESGFRADAIHDSESENWATQIAHGHRNLITGKYVPEYSVGPFQFNMRGGLGQGHSEESLKDYCYSANLAASRIAQDGSIWDGMRPWSVRPQAYALAVSNLVGDQSPVENGNRDDSPIFTNPNPNAGVIDPKGGVFSGVSSGLLRDIGLLILRILLTILALVLIALVFIGQLPRPKIQISG